MHVHVADLDGAIAGWLKKSVAVDAADWSYATCTGGKLNLTCAPSTAPTPVSARCFSVNAGRGPSDVAPFQTVYGVSGWAGVKAGALQRGCTCASAGCSSRRPPQLLLLLLRPQTPPLDAATLGRNCATTVVFSAKPNVFCVMRATDRAVSGSGVTALLRGPIRRCASARRVPPRRWAPTPAHSCPPCRRPNALCCAVGTSASQRRRSPALDKRRLTLFRCPGSFCSCAVTRARA